MNYAQRNKTILDRIDRHAAHPAAAELKKAALNCFAVAQKFSDQRDELLQDGRYSAEGKRAQLAAMAVNVSTRYLPIASSNTSGRWKSSISTTLAPWSKV